ncbi:hypothetical protein CSV75_01650 [Sporosarcina sp. P18a]|uniref:hypothetical protein n=1 Tax=Sporosarcina sp. P18a TaxID=2048259 RepID=UPI000C16FF6D|nr:hypothetical protein [Sporosarcina sp. P18a]PIC80523.1 hypothetical protein CSV75_01650 [Sporosarcina sp. P18a]
MYLQIHTDDMKNISQALAKLQEENKALKSMIDAERLHNTISEVADRIDRWLERPYQGVSEQQDIERFAEEITRYIDSQLRT